MNISHEEYNTILKEKNKYEKMKENVRSVIEKLEKNPKKHEIKQCKFKNNKFVYM